MVAEVRDIIAGVLGADIGPDEPLMDAGLDSLSGVEIKSTLETRLGVELPVTLVFDYPTINAIGGYIAANSRAGGEDLREDPRAVLVGDPAAPASLQGGIVLRALASETPRLCAAAAPSPLIEKDGVGHALLQRVDQERLNRMGVLVTFGGFLPDAELFDPAVRVGRGVLACTANPLGCYL